MTRSEQERLVERYLSGEMISADEEEFFMQVAVNQDLRQTLKAYRIVESAIRKQRDNAPSHHDQSRARLITMLSAHAAAHPTATHLAAAHPTAARQSAFRSAGKRLGRRITVSTAALQWFVGSVAVFAFTLGAFIVAPLLNDTPEAPAPAKAPAARPGPASQTLLDDLTGNLSAGTSVPASGTAPVSETVSSPDAAPSADVGPGTGPALRPAPATHAARRGAHAPAEAPSETAVKNRSAGRTRASEPGVTAQPESPASPKAEAPARKAANPKVVVRNSSLKVRVRVDRPPTPKE